MNAASKRGAAPVGFVTDLPAFEARAILYLRLWCGGRDGQNQVWNDFASAFGSQTGKNTLQDFEALVDMLLAHARRPLMRHQIGCSCVGADEAAFANFLAAAAEGAREDAMLLASLMARPDMAPVLTAMAIPVGTALLRLERAPSPKPTGDMVH